MRIKHTQSFTWLTVLLAGSFLLLLGACSQEEISSSVSSSYPILFSGGMGESGISASTRAAVAGNTAGAVTFNNNNNTALMGWYPQVGSGSTYINGVVTFSGLSDGVTDTMLG